MKVIAIANQKGGVGKTTTAVNLASGLAALGKDTLLIDLDPQGNATTGVGGDKEKKGTYEALVCEESRLLQNTSIPNLRLLSGCQDLAGAEIELLEKENKEYVLKNYLRNRFEKFSYIFIDCPPSLGMLTINALAASDEILIPMQCEYYALEGLSHLIKTVKRVKKNINPNLSIGGVILTMHDKRNSLSSMVEEDVRSNLGNIVYKTIIPRNVKIAEAPSHGKSVLLYDVNCSGALAYMQLASEFVKREKLKKGSEEW